MARDLRLTRNIGIAAHIDAEIGCLAGVWRSHGAQIVVEEQQLMESWQKAVPLINSGYHNTLLEQIAEMRKSKTIYPAQDKVLFALEVLSFDQVKVVLLGQDPYHGQGQAHGLAFSVPDGIKPPPSLRNIFKEIVADVYQGETQNFSTDLTRWAKQGVLLLNSALTVEAKKAGSHKKLGWHQLTDEIVEQLSKQRENLVFLLWGAHAQAKRALIEANKHRHWELFVPKHY